MRRFLILIFLITSKLLAQDFTQTIRGIVIDKNSQIPLIGATLVLNNNLQSGTLTNENGHFRFLTVPLGRNSISVSYMGYNTLKLENLIVISGKELVLTIELEENIQELKEIKVSGGASKSRPINKMAAVSARSFSVDETERYAGSWGDPARMAINFAGVMSAGDQRNDVIIRGNSPTGLLWRIDGINVPNPNHFGALGSTGGPISMLNNNLLSNSDFFSGAFPAEYGNALSGIFDLQLRSGNNEKYEFIGQCGFNGFEFGAEGPFSKKKKSSYILNYRYSTLDVINKLGISMGYGFAVPKYQDLTFKLNFPLKKGKLSLFGLSGISQINIKEDNMEDNNFKNIIMGLNTRNGSTTGIYGLSYIHPFNLKTRIKTDLAASGTFVNTIIDSIFENKPNKNFYTEENSENNLNLATKVSHKINAQHLLEAGFNVTDYFLNYLDSYLNDSIYLNLLDFQEQHIFLMDFFTQWQYRITSTFTLNSGLHYSYFLYNNSKSIEPRANLRWQLGEKQSLKFGYGLHSKIQPLFYYFIERYDEQTQTYEKTNKEMEFTKSNQFVIGYDYFFSSNFRLMLESYYQRLFDIPGFKRSSYYSLINEGASYHLTRANGLVNNCEGENYGIELTLEKFFSNHYYFLVTSSVFESKYIASDKIERNTAFNSNYVFNALGGYEIPINKNQSIDINLKFVDAGGKRNPYIDLQQSRLKGETVYNELLAFSKREADYFKIDFRISFKQNKRRISQEWAIDITNLTNHKNIYTSDYNAASKEIETVYQQGFFPMMLYRIHF